MAIESIRPSLSPRRRIAALLALALGGFAIGLTEFVVMGLLPQIAHSLLPALAARAHDQAVARAGWMMSVYALGVVVGAPLFTVLGARVGRTRFVIGLLVLFIVGTVASALAPTFPLVLLARFVAALPHGAYFGAAALIAASLMGPGSQGKGIAMVIGGLTVSNVVGVPLVTRLGQTAGWREAYLLIAAIFVLTLIAVAVLVPPLPVSRSASGRAELRALRVPQMWLVAAVAAIGFGGFFAVNSYIAEVVTKVTGRPSSLVPWALAAIGLGMTVGNVIGGWAADRNLRRSFMVGFPLAIASMILFAFIAPSVIGVFVGGFLVGATNLLIIPALQARLVAVAPGAAMMGAAVNQSATNVANSLGAFLGGLVIAHGFGYTAPTWVGVALASLGFGLIVISYLVEGRSERRDGLTRSARSARSAGSAAAAAEVTAASAAVSAERSAGARAVAGADDGAIGASSDAVACR